MSREEQTRLLLVEARLKGWPTWALKNWETRINNATDYWVEFEFEQLRNYVAAPNITSEYFAAHPLAPKAEDNNSGDNSF
jgi:hypothetical protein